MTVVLDFIEKGLEWRELFDQVSRTYIRRNMKFIFRRSSDSAPAHGRLQVGERKSRDGRWRHGARKIKPEDANMYIYSTVLLAFWIGVPEDRGRLCVSSKVSKINFEYVYIFNIHDVMHCLRCQLSKLCSDALNEWMKKMGKEIATPEMKDKVRY